MIVTRYINGVKIDGEMPELTIYNPVIANIIRRVQERRDEQTIQENQIENDGVIGIN